MTWDRVERYLGEGNLAALAAKRVCVAGLGSGGGFVALSLAMSGVGNFVLIDDDVLAPTNIPRHIADARYLGQAKSAAVADLIKGRNGAAQVDVRVGKVEDHLDSLDGVDLLVVGVDSEPAKYRVNEACLARGLTVVYAGVYARGEGGDVVVLKPGQGDSPCYACWAAELRDAVSLHTNEAGELDYGMIGADGTLEAEPGLYLHVVRVASVQADLALNELLLETSAHRQMPGNTVILANAMLEIVEGEVTLPYSAEWANITRDPNCLVCGDRASGRLADEDAISLDELVKDSGGLVEAEATQLGKIEDYRD